jgi:hypothetical protein
MRRVAGVGRCAALLAAVIAARVAHAQEPAPTPIAVLLPSTTAGVDPIVGRFVDRALLRGSEARGYAAVVDTAPAGSAPPSMVVLWNRVHQLGGEHAVHASVSARAGQYVVQLRIASRDGSGPRQAELSAGQAEIEAAVGALVEKTLPAPTNGAATPREARSETSPTKDAQATKVSTLTAETAPARQEPHEDAALELPSWRVALRDEFVGGLGEDDFVGVLVGGGADYRFDDSLWFGLRLAYANMPGRGERAESLLWYMQLEQRTDLSARVAVPLRLGLGYLDDNGSVLRMSAGIALDLGRGFGLQLDLLAPTFWITPDTTLFSMNLGLEATFVF